VLVDISGAIEETRRHVDPDDHFRAGIVGQRRVVAGQGRVSLNADAVRGFHVDEQQAGRASLVVKATGVHIEAFDRLSRLAKCGSWIGLSHTCEQKDGRETVLRLQNIFGGGPGSMRSPKEFLMVWSFVSAWIARRGCSEPDACRTDRTGLR